MKTQIFFKDKTIVGSPLKHFSILAAILFLFWVFMSGRLEAKFLFYGFVTAVVSAWICMPLLLLKNAVGTKKYFAFSVPPFSYLGYWLWLLKQVILANIEVVQATIGSEMRINPRMIRFKIKLDNPMAHATLANSITLTPGTVTLNVTKDGVYEVHALTDSAVKGLLSGDLQRRVADLYGEPFIYTADVKKGEF